MSNTAPNTNNPNEADCREEIASTLSDEAPRKSLLTLAKALLHTIRRRFQSQSLRIQRVQQNKTKIPYSHCRNCGTELSGPYCHNCGQSAHIRKLSFWGYLYSYICDIYHFDTKMLSAIVNLFRRPGYLTCEFIDGKIKSQANPLMLNMFLAILVVTIIAFNFKQISLDELNEDSYTTEELSWVVPLLSTELINANKTLDKCSSENTSQITLIADTDIIKQYPQLYRPLEPLSNTNGALTDTIRVVVPSYMIEEGLLKQTDTGEYLFPLKDLGTFNEEDMEMIKGIFNRMFPIIIMMIIPLLALMLKLCNIKRKDSFETHFVFTLHYSAFMQIIILLLSTLPNLLSIADYSINEIAIIIMPLIYLSIAMHRVYDTGWFSAILKSIFLLTSTFVLIILTIVILMVVFLLDKEIA